MVTLHRLPCNIPYSCPPPLIPAPPRWVRATPQIVSATDGMFNNAQLRHRRDPTPRNCLKLNEPRAFKLEAKIILNLKHKPFYEAFVELLAGQ